MHFSHAVREIEQLDPRCDHQRIVSLSYCYDFPIDAAILSVIILLRSFSAPRISITLDHSEEWARNGAARIAGLVRSIVILVGHGYDSHAGRLVIRRMNAAHLSYSSANDEFLYLLSRFVFEPVAWNARCGWRPYCVNEKEALFHFWTAVGQRMHVRDIPDDPAALHSFMSRYEQAHCGPDVINQRLFLLFRELLTSWFPPAARPLARWILPHLLDRDLREALLIPQPAIASRVAGRAFLNASKGLASLLPKRTRPYPFRSDPPFLYGTGPRLLAACDVPGHRATDIRAGRSAESPVERLRQTTADAEHRP